MNDYKYFLYIDILGFSELVKKGADSIEGLYRKIDALNAHKHDSFKTIVFSDTILIYNNYEPIHKHDHDYAVMFLCEFVQDLIYHLANDDIHFRAILTYGEFKHYSLKNMEAYYGKALVDSYYKEQDIIGMGLFIDKNIASHCIFNKVHYDKDLDFVTMLQGMDRIKLNYQGDLPTTDKDLIEDTDEYWASFLELKYLENIRNHSLNHPVNKVRGKFLQTYSLYKQLYIDELNFFEENGFNPSHINPSADWSRFLRKY